MYISQIKRLCTACELGTPLAEPQAVQGATLHRIWRLETQRGSFAIKQLNPAILREAGMDESYALSERIAADMAAHGIPAVAALTCAGRSLHTIEENTFLVYPWIAGEALPSAEPVEPARARLMGMVLGQIHALHLHYPELGTLHWKHFHDDDWDMLTFQAADQGLSWAYPVRAALPRLLEWSQQYEEAGTVLSQTVVVSHRDLDQSNVLWSDAQTPWLIDWEGAGLINPTMELLSLALDWCGQGSDRQPREETFQAVLTGYRAAGGTLHAAGLDALSGVIGNLLGRLLFMMRRSLGESVASDDEREQGIRETTRTLTRLRTLVGQAETWATAIDRSF